MSTQVIGMSIPPTLAFYCSSTSWGGLEMNTVRYAGWMKEIGFRVVVYGVRDTPFFRQSAMQGLDIRPVHRNKKYFDVLSARRLARQFQQDDISLVWFRDTRDMDTLGWAKRLSSRSFKLLYQQAMQFGVAKRDVFHTHRFRPIDAWVSTLDFLREQVESATRFQKQRIHVVPLGVDSSRLRIGEDLRSTSREYYGLKQEDFVFGVLGRLDVLKGQHLAIEALAEIHAKGKRGHLLIVGDSTLNEGEEYAGQLRKRAHQLGLEAYIHFHPHSHEVFHFYHAIDVFMLCSKGETFGTVTIEAMAMGLPIIGTDSSGTPEILDNGNSGLLVDADDSAGWPQAMLKMMDEPDFARALGSRAQHRFNDHYSKEISVRRLKEIVERCIA
jgi:D-inositol-3-phosphate glycosyltransferase